MKQPNLSDLEYGVKRRVSRRDRFIGETETVTSWSALVARIEPRHPKDEGRWRPPIDRERMLRMSIEKQRFGLCHEGIDDALYDSDIYQTRKSNEWHFRAKAHICADLDSVMVHTMAGAAANINDAT